MRYPEICYQMESTIAEHQPQLRRTDPARVARHWLVLAVATLWVLAAGTRAEEAEALGRPPTQVRTPPALGLTPLRRLVSVFARGLAWLRQQVSRGCLWRRLWLRPDPWPAPPPDLHIIYHGAT